MQIKRSPHNWSVSPKQAVAIQRRIAELRQQGGPAPSWQYIAGVDAAFTDNHCIAGVVLWSLASGRVVEQHTALAPLRFPYIPGLLTFREGPAIIAALRRLTMRPDVLLCDGQGIAHPRRCGIATHIGVLTGLPAVGCAKSRLLGEFAEPGQQRGERSELRDRGELIGTVLRTRTGVRPVFVSVGNLIELTAAEELVLACANRYRLPEPTRLADQLVAVAKRRLGG